VQSDISDVSLRYELDIGIQEGVFLCICENITRIVTSLSYCLVFEICTSGFYVSNSA
jgi:hypothetical protein